MDSSLVFNNKKYLSVKQASKLTGYSKDYISKLCREKIVAGRLIGRVWFVDEEAVIEYKNTPTSFDFIKNLEKKYNLSKDVPVQKVVKDKPLSVSKKRKPELVSSFSQKIIVLFSILIFVLGLSYDGWLSFGNVSKTISSLPSNTYKTLDELTNFYSSSLVYNTINSFFYNSIYSPLARLFSVPEVVTPTYVVKRTTPKPTPIVEVVPLPQRVA